METRQAKNYWTTRIRSNSGWLDIDFKGLLRYKDLVWLLVRRDFTLTYKQTILGPAWIVIQPLLTTLVFTVIFGNMAGLPTDGMPRFLFYLGGNIAWQFFANCLNRTSRTFLNNRALFEKVYFPRLCVPISTACSQLINFFVQYLLFIGFVVAYAVRPNPVVRPNWELILLTPVMLVQLAMLGMGFGLTISSVTRKYRDLAMLVSFGVQLWMYATPVTYPASMIADRAPELLSIYMLNPMTPLIEMFRSAYLGTECLFMNYYWLSVLLTVIIFVLGVLLFSHTEKTIMDTV